MGKKVLHGISGGIDSTVAAILLLEHGYEVVGITLRLYEKSGKFSALSPSESYINRAKEIADKLGIRHHIADAEEKFERNVIDVFRNEYLAGRTPSPCILCNTQIKWPVMIEKAAEMGCDFISTGHYAKILKSKGSWYIHKGKDPVKDQSYFLWNLNQQKLQKTLMPLGDLLKKEVVEIARKNNLLFGRKESMGVCFLEDKDYRKFLEDDPVHLDSPVGEGKVLDVAGKEIGKHKGYPYYTVGQKRDIQSFDGKEWYVISINAGKNILVAGTREYLYSDQFRVHQFYFANREDMFLEQISVLVRGYGLNPKGFCRITPLSEDLLQVDLDEKAWAMAPGQPVVFYHEDRVIGGAIVV